MITKEDDDSGSGVQNVGFEENNRHINKHPNCKEGGVFSPVY